MRAMNAETVLPPAPVHRNARGEGFAFPHLPTSGRCRALEGHLCVGNPAVMLCGRIYEERELEVRFGEVYVRYRAPTPFFI